MCFRRKSTSVSSRRRPRFPPDRDRTPIAVLDLSMPVERRAHDFLLRMTTGADKSWLLLTMRQREGALLCVVQWVHGNTDAIPYSVVDISLLESAVHWRDYKTADLAFAALAKLDAAAPGEWTHRAYAACKSTACGKESW